MLRRVLSCSQSNDRGWSQVLAGGPYPHNILQLFTKTQTQHPIKCKTRINQHEILFGSFTRKYLLINELIINAEGDDEQDQNLP